MTPRTGPVGLIIVYSLVGSGCYRGLGGTPGDTSAVSGAASEGRPQQVDGLVDNSASSGGDSAGEGAPGHHGEGDAELSDGRRVRRMTADQFHRSLVIVTGQPWPEFPEFAATMGRADYAEITEQGREISVTFDKFAHDAATYSCNAAVTADLAGGPGVMLRHATVADRDIATLRANLSYLMVRVLGQEMGAEDSRMKIWTDLLLADPADGTLSNELMQERWTAVCIGLLTHPDFFTY